MLRLGPRLPMLGSRLAPVAATVCSPYLSCVRFKRSAAKSGRVSAASGSDRSAALMMAIRQIESSFGKGAVMQLGSTKTAERVEVISSGSLSLDLALGTGGIPRGRVVEIYGPESSGKTTLALSCIAEAQKTEGGVCAFIDAEHAIDAHYAKALGVDIDALYVSQPDSGEEALEIADTLIRSGAVDSWCWTVWQLWCRVRSSKARLMSQALRKLTGPTAPYLPEPDPPEKWASSLDPRGDVGWYGVRYYASVRWISAVVGNETVVKVAKNKLASPFKVANFDMMFGRGIDRQSELLDLGVQHGLLKRSGAWYSLAGSDEPIAQGKAKAKVFLQENPEIAKDLEAKLRQMLFEPAEADEKVDEASVGADSEIADEDNATSTAEVGEAGTGETITG
ncbi:P-loop containing nucleoside triphosphate hydrolase [Phytophthora cactorum]|nr:P-loop containing nucleoside triphosphate hydrolase [Phytophthora cactorum]